MKLSNVISDIKYEISINHSNGISLKLLQNKFPNIKLHVINKILLYLAKQYNYEIYNSSQCLLIDNIHDLQSSNIEDILVKSTIEDSRKTFEIETAEELLSLPSLSILGILATFKELGSTAVEIGNIIGNNKPHSLIDKLINLELVNRQTMLPNQSAEFRLKYRTTIVHLRKYFRYFKPLNMHMQNEFNDECLKLVTNYICKILLDYNIRSANLQVISELVGIPHNNIKFINKHLILLSDNRDFRIMPSTENDITLWNIIDYLQFKVENRNADKTVGQYCFSNICGLLEQASKIVSSTEKGLPTTIFRSYLGLHPKREHRITGELQNNLNFKLISDPENKLSTHIIVSTTNCIDDSIQNEIKRKSDILSKEKVFKFIHKGISLNYVTTLLTNDFNIHPKETFIRKDCETFILKKLTEVKSILLRALTTLIRLEFPNISYSLIKGLYKSLELSKKMNKRTVHWVNSEEKNSKLDINIFTNISIDYTSISELDASTGNNIALQIIDNFKYQIMKCHYSHKVDDFIDPFYRMRNLSIENFISDLHNLNQIPLLFQIPNLSIDLYLICSKLESKNTCCNIIIYDIKMRTLVRDFGYPYNVEIDGVNVTDISIVLAITKNLSLSQFLFNLSQIYTNDYCDSIKDFYYCRLKKSLILMDFFGLLNLDFYKYDAIQYNKILYNIIQGNDNINVPQLYITSFNKYIFGEVKSKIEQFNELLKYKMKLKSFIIAKCNSILEDSELINEEDYYSQHELSVLEKIESSIQCIGEMNSIDEFKSFIQQLFTIFNQVFEWNDKLKKQVNRRPKVDVNVNVNDEIIDDFIDPLQLNNNDEDDNENVKDDEENAFNDIEEPIWSLDQDLRILNSFINSLIHPNYYKYPKILNILIDDPINNNELKPFLNMMGGLYFNQSSSFFDSECFFPFKVSQSLIKEFGYKSSQIYRRYLSLLDKFGSINSVIAALISSDSRNNIAYSKLIINKWLEIKSESSEFDITYCNVLQRIISNHYSIETNDELIQKIPLKTLKKIVISMCQSGWIYFKTNTPAVEIQESDQGFNDKKLKLSENIDHILSSGLSKYFISSIEKRIIQFDDMINIDSNRTIDFVYLNDIFKLSTVLCGQGTNQIVDVTIRKSNDESNKSESIELSNRSNENKADLRHYDLSCDTLSSGFGSKALNRISIRISCDIPSFAISNSTINSNINTIMSDDELQYQLYIYQLIVNSEYKGISMNQIHGPNRDLLTKVLTNLESSKDIIQVKYFSPYSLSCEDDSFYISIRYEELYLSSQGNHNLSPWMSTDETINELFLFKIISKVISIIMLYPGSGIEFICSKVQILPICQLSSILNYMLRQNYIRVMLSKYKYILVNPFSSNNIKSKSSLSYFIFV